MKPDLDFEERIRAVYAHFVDKVPQQAVATLLGVNIGRVNEACKAAEHALRPRRIDKKAYRKPDVFNENEYEESEL